MLETSHLAQRWMAVSTNGKKQKLGQKGSSGRHVTHFWNFGTPPLISPELLNLETSSLTQKWMSTDEKMQNLVKIGYVGSRDPLIKF